MPTLTAPTQVSEAVAEAAIHGLTATPKTLPPWLFYDEVGSELFEQITALPEYYLTRSERALFAAHAEEIFDLIGQEITIAELGAGTASKTGILLRALTQRQPQVVYQPIDISPSALDEAAALEAAIPGLLVQPQVANYITEPIHIDRPAGHSILALYIGSSIGNFSPDEAQGILTNLRAQLRLGDALLLGTDLAPSATKSVATLLAAYDDAAGVTAAFNRNILDRLNRDLAADFNPQRFAHRALWNPAESRIEMYLEAVTAQQVRVPANAASPALTLHFSPGETIHTENSYKFSSSTIAALLTSAGFTSLRTFTGPANLYAVTLAKASDGTV